LAGRGLCRLCDRCVRPQDRRLAGLELAQDRPGAGCTGTGAIYERTGTNGLVHHSDRGSQYLSIRYTERLAEAGIKSSVGSVGDSYDNALAETIIGLFKTEIIRPRGPWKNIDTVEYATLEWVDWFNKRRLLESIGDIPPAELEQAYDDERETQAMVA